MPRPYPRGVTRAPLTSVPAGMRVMERSVVVPPAARDAVAELVSSWEFKRRAGFETPTAAPVPGEEGVLVKQLFGVRFAEPVRVVWADGRGFGYETMPGHPLYGEESFILGEDGVFTARSVSRPATRAWRLANPALQMLQRQTMRRYVAVVEHACATLHG